MSLSMAGGSTGRRSDGTAPALMDIKRAAPLLRTSALALSVRTLDILPSDSCFARDHLAAATIFWAWASSRSSSRSIEHMCRTQEPAERREARRQQSAACGPGLNCNASSPQDEPLSPSTVLPDRRERSRSAGNMLTSQVLAAQVELKQRWVAAARHRPRPSSCFYHAN